MKNIFALILASAIATICFAQGENKAYTGQEQTQESDLSKKNSTGSYQGIIETGYAFGIGEYGMNNFNLNFINSISLNQYFSTGLGIGLIRKYEKDEFYEKGKWPTANNKCLFPVFLDLRTNLMNKKTSPYLALGIGGYFGIYGMWAGVKGGFYITPSVGIRYKISAKTAIIGALDYQMQNMEFFDSPSSTYPREKVSSIGFKIGFLF